MTVPHNGTIMLNMIKSFRCANTEKLFEDGRNRHFNNIRNVSLRKLDMLSAASELRDLRSPPGNRLEALGGNRLGQYSIRINQQWRICFRWHDHDVYDVETVDYH